MNFRNVPKEFVHTRPLKNAFFFIEFTLLIDKTPDKKKLISADFMDVFIFDNKCDKSCTHDNVFKAIFYII